MNNRMLIWGLTLCFAVFLMGCSKSVNMTTDTLNEVKPEQVIRVELIDEGNSVSFSDFEGERVSGWYLWNMDSGTSSKNKTIVFNGG